LVIFIFSVFEPFQPLSFDDLLPQKKGRDNFGLFS